MFEPHEGIKVDSIKGGWLGEDWMAVGSPTRTHISFSPAHHRSSIDVDHFPYDVPSHIRH